MGRVWNFLEQTGQAGLGLTGSMPCRAGPDGECAMSGWAWRGVCQAGLGLMGSVPGRAGPDGECARSGWAWRGVCQAGLGLTGSVPGRAGPDGECARPGWAWWGVMTCTDLYCLCLYANSKQHKKAECSSVITGICGFLNNCNYWFWQTLLRENSKYAHISKKDN